MAGISIHKKNGKIYIHTLGNVTNPKFVFFDKRRNPVDAGDVTNEGGGVFSCVDNDYLDEYFEFWDNGSLRLRYLPLESPEALPEDASDDMLIDEGVYEVTPLEREIESVVSFRPKEDCVSFVSNLITDGYRRAFTFGVLNKYATTNSPHILSQKDYDDKLKSPTDAFDLSGIPFVVKDGDSAKFVMLTSDKKRILTGEDAFNDVVTLHEYRGIIPHIASKKGEAHRGEYNSYELKGRRHYKPVEFRYLDYYRGSEYFPNRKEWGVGERTGNKGRAKTPLELNNTDFLERAGFMQDKEITIKDVQYELTRATQWGVIVLQEGQSPAIAL